MLCSLQTGVAVLVEWLLKKVNEKIIPFYPHLQPLAEAPDRAAQVKSVTAVLKSIRDMARALVRRL